MAYASYEYYRCQFAGEIIPENLFRRCVSYASSQIDYYTFHRIKDPEGVENLADCACEMAEAVYNIRYKDGGKVKKLENIDGYSVSYLAERKDGEDADVLLRGKLYGICCTYLAHTGLMYRGIGGC